MNIMKTKKMILLIYIAIASKSCCFTFELAMEFLLEGYCQPYNYMEMSASSVVKFAVRGTVQLAFNIVIVVIVVNINPIIPCRSTYIRRLIQTIRSFRLLIQMLSTT